MQESEFLQYNLDRWVPIELARRIQAITPSHAELSVGPTGNPTLRFGGIAMCSSMDPQAEAEAWVNTCELENATRVIIIGLALAHHLRAIRKRTEAPIIVLEPSIEIIHLVLSHQRLDIPHLKIVDTPHALRECLAAELEIGEQLAVHAWPPYRRLFPELFVAAREAIRQGAYLASLTSRTLEKRVRVWTKNLLENLPRCAGRVPYWALKQWYPGKPAIIVAAGPSLDRNIHDLVQAQERALILAVNTSLRALDKAQVRADLVVALEVMDVTSQYEDLRLNQRCPRVVCLTSHPALFQANDTPIFPFSDQLPFFAPLTSAAGFNEGMAMGGSVANAAFALAREMGANPIILVGQDLAYSAGKVYASGTVFSEMKANIDNGVVHFEHLEAKERIARSLPELDTTMPTRDVEPTQAWGGKGIVWTTTDFNYFRHHLEQCALDMPDTTLINATEGGAHIQGFAERKLQEIIDPLPILTRPPLPQTPTLTAHQIQQALEQERNRIQEVQQNARLAVIMNNSAAFLRLNQAIMQSDLFQAYAWSNMQEILRTIENPLPEFCRIVLQEAEELLGFF